MNDEIIIVDQAYKYQVDEILDGGIGYVRLLSMQELSRRPPDLERLENPECVGDYSKYPYRNRLAAKTIKHLPDMEKFSRGCEVWLELNLPGVVPLLRLIKNGDETLALMPRYAGNLRMLMQNGRHAPMELLKALYPVVACLSKVDNEFRIVHQAIKPENILYCYQNQKLILELSDWGIAKVQNNLLPNTNSDRIKMLDAFGVLPYLAPERFDTFLSDIRADIFSLGMVFFELFTGSLPYSGKKTVTDQVVSGEYYRIVEDRRSLVSNEKVMEVILQMLHPEVGKRPQAYGDILKLIAVL